MENSWDNGWRILGEWWENEGNGWDMNGIMGE